VIAAVLGAGAVYAAIRQPAHAAARGVAQAHGPRGTARGHRVRGVAAPPAPLRVMSVSPAAGARGVDGADPVRVTPETLTIWHDGQVVFTHAANTGIPVAPTADGTYPVYLLYRFQVMRGVNPDGSHYADPVAFVAYFNGGDAVHYFPRASCGSPQSLGCVEFPRATAERAWRYLTYGSLVTVTG
jgi:hypothetical protein